MKKRNKHYILAAILGGIMGHVLVSFGLNILEVAFITLIQFFSTMNCIYAGDPFEG